LGFWEKFGDDFGSNRGFWSKNGGWRVSLWGLGETGKVETFKNVRKRLKIFKNIQKHSNFEYKRSKIFKNIRLFLDADCAEKYSHKKAQKTSAFAKASVFVPNGFIKGLRRTRRRTSAQQSSATDFPD